MRVSFIYFYKENKKDFYQFPSGIFIVINLSGQSLLMKYTFIFKVTTLFQLVKVEIDRDREGEEDFNFNNRRRRV